MHNFPDIIIKSELSIYTIILTRLYLSEAYTRSGEWQLVHCPVLVNSNERDPLYQDITFYFIIRNSPQIDILLHTYLLAIEVLRCYNLYCAEMTMH